MVILSLFDGLSCGQIAINKLGLKNYTYYASEIDKYAIKVTRENYPNTIHIGDVTKVSYKDGVLYTESGSYNVGKIDMLIGGSPCTNISFSGKQQGLRGKIIEEYLQLKSEGFDFGKEQSHLFWEYVRIFKEVNPEYFLLENVKMKKEWSDVITETLGVPFITINSSLLSAQNRVRLYWTNIEGIEQPENKGLCVADILEDSYEYVGCMVGRRLKNGKRADYDLSVPIKQIFEINKNKKSNCLTTVGKDNLVFIGAFEKGRRLDDGKILSRNFREGYRLYSIDGKAATLTAQTKGGMGGHSGLYGEEDGGEIYYRSLTPLECERLQTVPDFFTASVSDSQRCKMLGNGWTVDVICHILKNVITPQENKPTK